MNGGTKALLAVLAVTTVFPSASTFAQCRLCAEAPEPERVEQETRALRLEIETILDFDRLILTGAQGGSVILDPRGASIVSGSIAGLSGRAMVGSAIVRGEPNRAIRVDLPGRIDLYGLTGGRIIIDQLSSDVPQTTRLDSAGTLTFRFGGRLRIDGEVDGDFRGDVPITVEYL